VRGLPAQADREEGTILVLTLGLLAVAVGTVVAVVDVSTVFLARRDLAGVCDSAALAAAQAVDPSALYAGSAPARLPLDRTGAARAAARVAAGAQGVAERTTVIGPAEVGVACTRSVPLPLARVLGLGSVTVTANATAETALR